MRLLGAHSASFQLVADGVRVSPEKGESYVILAESLGREASFQEGKFFSKLVFLTNQGEKTIQGLRKRDAQVLFEWLRSYWIAKLSPEVLSAADQIQDILTQGYTRSSRFTQAFQLATDMTAMFRVVPEPSWSEGLDITPFQYVAQIAQWQRRDLENHRQQYVAEQLDRYSEYFDQIESQPLTQRQREACVIDEDNNLVLAGAGTGKTSTMVGRAGYLIKSGQANGNEILMLAFANKAAVEMQERIELRLPDCSITCSTFHKLGKSIIASVEGQQPALTPFAEDEKGLAKQVSQWFESHLETPEYRDLTLKYFQYYLYPQANPFDFESEGAYFDYILANDIRTLKGEAVKSLGECQVANYLLKQGIEYRYEADYEHNTATPLHRQYRPDFYLPEHGIYIEYYGIDSEGKTAPYINQAEYLRSMEWKRQLHQQMGTQLIELYHYQMLEGDLFAEIDQQLSGLGVQYDPLSPEAVLDTLREFGAINSFAVLLAELLKRYRANCYETDQIETVCAQTDNEAQVKAALTLLRPILADYQSMLDRAGHIDFDDMIGKAIQYVKSGRFKSPWRYILVDEFQDISDARARLVKYLRDAAGNCSLFCVGDDWQAIYRFTGSDLRFTTNFSANFGATKVSALDLTFRFNNSISDIATRFVLQNPFQVNKQLNTHCKVNRPAVSLLREDNRASKGEDTGRLEKVLSSIAAQAKPRSTVYLLGRFGFNLPDRTQLLKLNKQFEQITIQSYTIHASKGKEADYVVILGLETGKHGFPSEKTTHPLLEALLPTMDDHPYSEERRLFYVALTRAKHRAYLITDMAVASKFVVELLQDEYEIELNEFETSLSQQLLHLLKCIKCKTGTLVPRQSQFGQFFGCNKFPLCNHKERGCQQCGSQMRRSDRFKVCINPDCQNWVPICPKCGAEMTLRKGRYGEFWGCRNYRHEGECCRHTEDTIVFDEKFLSEGKLLRH